MSDSRLHFNVIVTDEATPRLEQFVEQLRRIDPLLGAVAGLEHARGKYGQIPPSLTSGVGGGQETPWPAEFVRLDQKYAGVSPTSAGETKRNE